MRPDNLTAPRIQRTHFVPTCPLCGTKRVVTVIHSDTFTYGTGRSAVQLSVELPVRSCQSCDITFLDQVGERLKHNAVCRHLRVLTPEEIRSIREYHQMTRARFSEVTGLGEATLARWEAGAVIQNRANDRYLRLLRTDTTMDRLIELVEDSSAAQNGSRDNQPQSRRFPGFTPTEQMLVFKRTFQLTVH